MVLGVVLSVVLWYHGSNMVGVFECVCEGLSVVADVVLGVKLFFQPVVRSSERCAFLCLGRTLAGKGGPSRKSGTVRWGRRPELGMKMKGAVGR